MIQDPKKEIENFATFSKIIRKVSQKRKHKATNSYGVLDVYNSYKKECTKNKVTLQVFRQVVRSIGKANADSLSLGNEVYLPYNMGTVELRKYYPNNTIVNGKLKTTLAIDWFKTLKLWFEEPSLKKNKRLIKCETNELFKIFYNKKKAKYSHKTNFHFAFNRKLKLQLKQNINNNLIDAYLI